MGEEPGEGDEVVDEKLWGEDEERPNDPNAKTEKDAPVKVSSRGHSHDCTRAWYGTACCMQCFSLEEAYACMCVARGGLPCSALIPW